MEKHNRYFQKIRKSIRNIISSCSTILSSSKQRRGMGYQIGMIKTRRIRRRKMREFKEARPQVRAEAGTEMNKVMKAGGPSIPDA